MSDSPEYQRFLAAMAPPVKTETIMAKTHYHVGYNMPGYMPEMDPYVVSSKRAAISAVKDEASHLNDDYCEEHNGRHHPYVASGRATDGDIWLAPRDCAGTGAELHIWYQGPCMCPEGSHMLDCDKDSHYSCGF